MAHPVNHAESSARKFGGKPSDYLAVHNWFDQSKSYFADFRHRALRHHSEGIFLCESIFGVTIKNSDDREVPVRQIGEQHVREDLGWIPTVADWLKNIRATPWMMRGVKKQSGANDLMDSRKFPMQNGPAIPWALAEKIYEQYAFVYGQDQSLERLAERGGFGWAEVEIIYKKAAEKRRMGR